MQQPVRWSIVLSMRSDSPWGRGGTEDDDLDIFLRGRIVFLSYILKSISVKWIDDAIDVVKLLMREVG